MLNSTIVRVPVPGAMMPPAPAPVGPQSDDIWKVEYPAIDDSKEMLVASELRRRVTEGESADSEFLKNAEFELDFLDNHWLEEETGSNVGRRMQSIGRSAFDIDLLNPAIDLTVNQARINKVSANFIPAGENSSKATADIRSGLYRNIDRRSKGAIARETAYQLAVSVGRGYYRVNIEDEAGPSFGRQLALSRITNLRSVLIDPTGLDFDYSDAEWAYVFEDIYKEKFRAEHTRYTEDGEPDGLLDISGESLTSDDVRSYWFPKDKVRVGEYFRKVWRRRMAWKLIDGTQCWKEDAPPDAEARGMVVATKVKLDYKIEWRKMTGTQTIEKREWPGRYLPIVVVIGREVFRGTKPKIHRGMIRPAIAPTRIHDVMFSRMVDEVGLSPLPHFIAYTGQVQPEQKKIINTINQTPWSVIEIDSIFDQAGNALPISGWVSPSPNTSAVVQAAQLASDKLDRVLNTYAPNRGQSIADQSGKAIREIKDSGDISHAAFPDNLQRAITHEAEIINDLMDYVYTDKQAITITRLDEKTQQVLINQEYVDEDTGKTVHHIFGPGAKYDVSTTLQASYPSRMAEAAQKLLDLAKIFPQQVSQALDLLIQDLNVPNAAKYAPRFRPPGFSDEDGPSRQELMQHIQQSEVNAQQAEAIIQKLLKKVAELGDQKAIKLLEIESKERIADASVLGQITVAEVKAGQDASHMVLGARLDHILSVLESDLETPDEGSEDAGSGGSAEPPPAAPGGTTQQGIGGPPPPTPTAAPALAPPLQPPTGAPPQ